MALVLALAVCWWSVDGQEVTRQFEFQKDGMIPEGVDYAEGYGFFLSSLGLGSVYLLDPNSGDLRVFANAPQLTSTAGLQVDENAGLIYCCNSAGDNGRGSIVVIRLVLYLFTTPSTHPFVA